MNRSSRLAGYGEERHECLIALGGTGEGKEMFTEEKLENFF